MPPGIRDIGGNVQRMSMLIQGVLARGSSMLKLTSTLGTEEEKEREREREVVGEQNTLLLLTFGSPLYLFYLEVELVDC